MDVSKYWNETLSLQLKLSIAHNIIMVGTEGVSSLWEDWAHQSWGADRSWYGESGANYEGRLAKFNLLASMYAISWQVLPLVDVEMEAGDALFFHSNVLHRSDKNDSDRRRWAFLIAYNRTSNNPVYPHHHPQYTKLEKVQPSITCHAYQSILTLYYI